MSTHFQKKSARTKQEIPTASMPDIIFMLLIFFMVTTVLREVDLKVRFTLPSAEEIEKIEEKRLVSYIYIGRIVGGQGTGVQIDDSLIEEEEFNNIRQIMYNKLTEQPRLIVSLRVDEKSDMGIVRDVEQELRQAGTYKINYSTKRQIAAN